MKLSFATLLGATLALTRWHEALRSIIGVVGAGIEYFWIFCIEIRRALNERLNVTNVFNLHRAINLPLLIP